MYEVMREKLLEILAFYLKNGLENFFQTQLWHMVVNHHGQIYKQMNVHTIHCTLNTVLYLQYRQKLSTPEKNQGRVLMSNIIL